MKKQCEIKDSRIKELNGKLEVIEEKEKIRENNVDPLFEKKTQEMDIKYYIDVMFHIFNIIRLICELKLRYFRNFKRRRKK